MPTHSKRALGIPASVKAALRRRKRLPALWYIGPLEDQEMPKTWPNGVPYIDEDTRKERLNDPEALRDLIHHLYIHSAYGEHGAVRKMTTEQKELYADVVDTWPRDFEAEPYDRWWQRDR